MLPTQLVNFSQPSQQIQKLQKHSRPQTAIRFSGDGTSLFDQKLGESNWTVGKAIKTAVYSLLGIGAGVFTVTNMGMYDNDPGEVSVKLNKYWPGGGFSKDANGLIQLEPTGWGGLFFQENKPFDTRPQVIRDTLQPYSKDGVRIKGSGQNPDEGIDIRLTYEIARDAKFTGPIHEDPVLKKSIDTLLMNVIGYSKGNPKHFDRSTTQFETSDNEKLKMIYFVKILPMLQEYMDIASIRLNASDMHEQRATLEDILQKGLKRTLVDEEGKKQEVTIIRPLQEQMADWGLTLVGFELSNFDVPQFLRDLNDNRRNITIENTTTDATIKQLAAKQGEEVAKIKAKWAKTIEEQRGTNQQEIAAETGKVNKAKEDAKKTEQTALGQKSKRLATADGYARTEKAKAETDAAETIRDANVYKAEKAAEAAEKSAGILAQAKAQASTLAALGEQLTDALLTKELQDATFEIQALVGKNNVGGMILAPGTSPTKVLGGLIPDTAPPSTQQK